MLCQLCLVRFGHFYAWELWFKLHCYAVIWAKVPEIQEESILAARDVLINSSVREEMKIYLPNEKQNWKGNVAFYRNKSCSLWHPCTWEQHITLLLLVLVARCRKSCRIWPRSRSTISVSVRSLYSSEASCCVPLDSPSFFRLKWREVGRRYVTEKMITYLYIFLSYLRGQCVCNNMLSISLIPYSLLQFLTN